MSPIACENNGTKNTVTLTLRAQPNLLFAMLSAAAEAIATAIDLQNRRLGMGYSLPEARTIRQLGFHYSTKWAFEKKHCTKETSLFKEKDALYSNKIESYIQTIADRCGSALQVGADVSSDTDLLMGLICHNTMMNHLRATLSLRDESISLNITDLDQPLSNQEQKQLRAIACSIPGRLRRIQLYIRLLREKHMAQSKWRHETEDFGFADCGFSSIEASLWQVLGFTPTLALRWSQEGFGPVQAHQFHCQHYSPKEAKLRFPQHL